MSRPEHWCLWDLWCRGDTCLIECAGGGRPIGGGPASSGTGAPFFVTAAHQVRVPRNTSCADLRRVERPAGQPADFVSWGPARTGLLRRGVANLRSSMTWTATADLRTYAIVDPANPPCTNNGSRPRCLSPVLANYC